MNLFPESMNLFPETFYTYGQITSGLGGALIAKRQLAGAGAAGINIAQFFAKAFPGDTGYNSDGTLNENFKQANMLLYGIGAFLDTRDFDAILAAPNVKQAAIDATVAMFSDPGYQTANWAHLLNQGYDKQAIDIGYRQIKQNLGINFPIYEQQAINTLVNAAKNLDVYQFNDVAQAVINELIEVDQRQIDSVRVNVLDRLEFEQQNDIVSSPDIIAKATEVLQTSPKTASDAVIEKTLTDVNTALVETIELQQTAAQAQAQAQAAAQAAANQQAANDYFNQLRQQQTEAEAAALREMEKAQTAAARNFPWFEADMFVNATAQQKAAAYLRYLDMGKNASEIRSAAEAFFGKQRDEDWQLLQEMARQIAIDRAGPIKVTEPPMREEEFTQLAKQPAGNAGAIALAALAAALLLGA